MKQHADFGGSRAFKVATGREILPGRQDLHEPHELRCVRLRVGGIPNTKRLLAGRRFAGPTRRR
jgi:hypothetical protein